MSAHVIANPRPALVGIDGLTHEAADGNMWGYAAHISDRFRWNGWGMPMFTMAECERIAAQAATWNASQVEWYGAENALDSMCNSFTYDAERGVWLESDPRYMADGGGGPWECPTAFLPDGVQVWGLGDGYCWAEVDTDAEIPMGARAVLA